jgi:uncharacterized protein YndB with AHSA1/START domain
MATNIPDRIEKKILLRAPRSRVWRAITDTAEFNSWFRVTLTSPFIPGKETSGKITYPGYEHLTMTVWWRSSSRSVEEGMDYAGEPTTLVEFHLEEGPEGTLVTLTESGFDNVPQARRAKAFESNDQGWAEQMQNLERHVLGKGR